MAVTKDFKVRISIESDGAKAFKEGEAGVKKYGEAMDKSRKIAEDYANSQKSVFENMGDGFVKAIQAATDLGKTLATSGAIVYGAGKAYEYMTTNQGKFIAEAQAGSNVIQKSMFGLRDGLNAGKEAALGFRTAATTATKTAAVGFLGLFEVMALLGPAVGLVGVHLQAAESATMRLTGKMLILAGLLSVSLVAGVVYLVEGIGKLAEALGDRLISSMEAFRDKAIQMESALSAFTFTVAGFTRELGSQAVGTLEYWQTIMADIVKTTVFTQKEVMKAVGFFIKEGTALGISAADNAMLLSRATDIAAANGVKLEDASQAILNGLKGQSQALFNLGVDISDAALSHSNYVAALGKTVEQLTDLEKQQARFSLVMEKTAPLMGAAVNATLTAEGANAQLAKSIDTLQAKLGAQGVLTAWLNKIQAQFLNSLLQVPDFLVNAIGTFQDFAGVILKVGGFLLKNVFWILTLKTAYTVLTYSVANYAIVQGTLNVVMGAAAGLLGVQIKMVTSLSVAYANLAIIGRALIANFGGVLLTAMKGLGAAFVKLGAILLPIIAKLALVGAVVYGFVQGFKELMQSSQAFRNIAESVVSVIDYLTGAVKGATSSSGIFAQAWSGLIDVLFRSVILIKDIAKLIMIGLVQTGQVAAIAFLKIRQMLANKEEAEGYRLAIEEIQNQMDELSGETTKAVASIASFADGTAVAATEAEKLKLQIKGIGGEAHETAEELQKLVEANMKNFNKQNEATKILGTEFQKAVVKQIEAQTELTKAQNLNARGGEKAKAIAEATQALYKANIDVLKLSQDTFKDFAKEEDRLNIERLRNSGRTVEAIELEFAATRKAFEAQVAGVRLLKPLTEDQIKSIDRMRVAMNDAEAAAIKDENLRKLKESIGSLTDDLKRLQEQTIDMNKEAEKRGKDAIELADIDKAASNQIADNLEKQLNLLGQFSPYADEIIKKFKLAAQAKADFAAIDAAKAQLGGMNPVAAAVGAATISTAQAINDAIPSINKWFGTEFEKFSGKAIAKFAVAAGRFFQDFEGFIGGGAKMLGGAITGGAMIMDKFLGTSFGEGASAIASAIGTIGENMGFVLDYLIKGLKLVLTSDLINAFSDVLSTIGNLPEEMLKVFQNLGDIVSKLAANFGTMLNKFLAQLPNILTKLANELPKVLQMIIRALPTIARAIIDAIPMLVQGILDAIPELIRAFSSIIQMLIKAIPGLITQIMNALPGIVTTLFEEIPKIFAEIFKAIPTIIENLLENIDEFVLAFVEGFIGAMGEIVGSFIDEFLLGGGIERIIGAILRAIPRIALALVQGIVRGLVRAISGIFGGGFELPESITKLPENISKGAEKLGKQIAKEASQIFQVKDLENAMQGLGGQKSMPEMLEDAFDYGAKKLNPLAEMWKKAWKWVMDKIITPAVEMFKEVWNFINDTIIQPMIEGVKAVWNFVNTTVIQPMISAIRAVWNYANSIWASMMNILRTAWDGVYNFFSNIFKGKINEAFAGIFDTFKNVGSQIWEGLKAGIAGGLDVFKGIGSNIWNSLREGLNGLGDFFRNTLDSINPANLLAKLFRFDGGGKGDVENALSRITGGNIDVPFVGFAQGGTVPGRALVAGDSALNDRIVALLSPGEAVIPRSMMNNPSIAGIVQAILNGTLNPPAFRAGGWVGQQQDKAAAADPSTGGGGPLGKVVRDAAGGIISVAQDAYTSGQDAANQAAEAAKEAGGYVSEKYKVAIKWLEQFDPSKLWEMFKEKGMSSLGDMWNNADRFHSGGLVPAFAGGGEVPAILQPGEFVINRKSTQNNRGLLSSINSGGGLMGNGRSGNGGVNIENITINAKTMLDADQIRREVIPAIERDLKRKSIDGQKIIASTGVERR